MLFLQALVEKEQGTEDLEKLQHRMADLIAEHQEKLHKERQLTRKECEQQIDQLNKKVEIAMYFYTFCDPVQQKGHLNGQVYSG